MSIKVMVLLSCDQYSCVNKKPVMTTADLEVSFKFDNEDSDYETSPIPIGTDVCLDPKLPEGWTSHQSAGYGYRLDPEYLCPDCSTARARSYAR